MSSSAVCFIVIDLVSDQAMKDWAALTIGRTNMDAISKEIESEMTVINEPLSAVYLAVREELGVDSA